MKEIPLSRGLVAYVDDEDYDLVSAFKWHAHIDGYAVRNTPRDGGGRTLILMHRAILGLESGRGVFVDHVNMNRADNRRCNLRPCNRSDNGANRHMLKNNTSGYKGVSWHKHSGKYIAKIRKNGVVKSLGYFHDPLAASHAYLAAASEIHGAFSRDA
jgi:hypothetical protein